MPQSRERRPRLSSLFMLFFRTDEGVFPYFFISLFGGICHYFDDSDTFLVIISLVLSASRFVFDVFVQSVFNHYLCI